MTELYQQDNSAFGHEAVDGRFRPVGACELYLRLAVKVINEAGLGQRILSLLARCVSKHGQEYL
jgi:hypothetical protein